MYEPEKEMSKEEKQKRKDDGSTARVLRRSAVTLRPLAQDPRRYEQKVLGGPVSSGSPAPGPGSSPASTNAPSAVADFNDEATGLDAISRLAVGDVSAETEYNLRGRTGNKASLQSHEWGLGLDSGQQAYRLYSAGKGEIDWELLPGIISVAHSHPYEAINLAQIQDFLGTKATTLADILACWLNGTETVPDTRDTPIDFVEGHFGFLFPSNADLISTFTRQSTRSETLCTPFRLGKDGWLSQDDGPPLTVEFGPAYAVLTKETNQIIAAAKGNPYQSEPDQLLSMCVRAYVTLVTFKARGLGEICSGWETAAPGPEPMNFAYYRKQLQPDQNNMLSRRQVEQYIKERLA